MNSASVEDVLRGVAPEVLGALVRRYGHFDLAEEGGPGEPAGGKPTVAG